MNLANWPDSSVDDASAALKSRICVTAALLTKFTESCDFHVSTSLSSWKITAFLQFIALITRPGTVNI
jgi:hypothetical protein